MRMTGNTIFITGGTSGIGRGLAEAFYERGNEVIICGRRKERLEEMRRRFPRMACLVLDVTRAESIRSFVRRLISEYPSLNCVINNAGVQMCVSFSGDGEFDDEGLQAEININLLGPMRITAAVLPHLVRLGEGKSPLKPKEGLSGPLFSLSGVPFSTPVPTLINVSSGLAFVPMARFPVYCATKAGIHSWTMSLRHQLRSSGIKVVELIPPYVATELGGPGKAVPAGAPQPIALDAFIAETMRELETDADEIAVGEAKRLVGTASTETIKQVFSRMNGERPSEWKRSRMIWNRPACGCGPNVCCKIC